MGGRKAVKAAMQAVAAAALLAVAGTAVAGGTWNGRGYGGERNVYGFLAADGLVAGI